MCSAIVLASRVLREISVRCLNMRLTSMIWKRAWIRQELTNRTHFYWAVIRLVTMKNRWYLKILLTWCSNQNYMFWRPQGHYQNQSIGYKSPVEKESEVFQHALFLAPLKIKDTTLVTLYQDWAIKQLVNDPPLAQLRIQNESRDLRQILLTLQRKLHSN